MIISFPFYKQHFLNRKMHFFYFYSLVKMYLDRLHLSPKISSKHALSSKTIHITNTAEHTIWNNRKYQSVVHIVFYTIAKSHNLRMAQHFIIRPYFQQKNLKFQVTLFCCKVKLSFFER